MPAMSSPFAVPIIQSREAVRLTERHVLPPHQQVAPLFGDAHSVLHALTNRSEHIRKVLARNDEVLRHDIKELSTEIQDTTYSRRDVYNRLRYEFETFLHRKAEKVVQELEEMSRAQQRNDAAQQEQLNDLSRDIFRLKANLVGVQARWARFVKMGALSATIADASVCSCGNAFMADAMFCRKCGKERAEKVKPRPAQEAPPPGESTEAKIQRMEREIAELRQQSAEDTIEAVKQQRRDLEDYQVKPGRTSTAPVAAVSPPPLPAEDSGTMDGGWTVSPPAEA